jgi:hypothetical protein
VGEPFECFPAVGDRLDLPVRQDLLEPVDQEPLQVKVVLDQQETPDRLGQSPECLLKLLTGYRLDEISGDA